ncbi:hypothetical protein F383_37032 [Gossypium arboreum]|uniref:Uncharacterized protein n=1 Tax=Gossypium arboreum TaxID=29729 RepID=A0A0B0MDU3_GOSAR|nr:hypothetical protein F383_37032 [Gossypium arboreum]
MYLGHVKHAPNFKLN